MLTIGSSPRHGEHSFFARRKPEWKGSGFDRVLTCAPAPQRGRRAQCSKRVSPDRLEASSITRNTRLGSVIFMRAVRSSTSDKSTSMTAQTQPLLPAAFSVHFQPGFPDRRTGADSGELKCPSMRISSDLSGNRNSGYKHVVVFPTLGNPAARVNHGNQEVGASREGVRQLRLYRPGEACTGAQGRDIMTIQEQV